MGYRPPILSSVGYRPPILSSVGYRPPILSSVGYRPPILSSVGYRPPILSLCGVQAAYTELCGVQAAYTELCVQYVLDRQVFFTLTGSTEKLHSVTPEHQDVHNSWSGGHVTQTAPPPPPVGRAGHVGRSRGRLAPSSQAQHLLTAKYMGKYTQLLSSCLGRLHHRHLAMLSTTLHIQTSVIRAF